MREKIITKFARFISSTRIGQPVLMMEVRMTLKNDTPKDTEWCKARWKQVYHEFSRDKSHVKGSPSFIWTARQCIRVTKSKEDNPSQRNYQNQLSHPNLSHIEQEWIWKEFNLRKDWHLTKLEGSTGKTKF